MKTTTLVEMTAQVYYNLCGGVKSRKWDGGGMKMSRAKGEDLQGLKPSTFSSPGRVSGKISPVGIVSKILITG